ncbi:hypothetical protein C0J52_02264 [Blattella germanica]|nr:hypothetical protein C0J52_02264 [Blattella germanica]PSN46086.1 hypothetical protein C0J52_02264 [Blattella germanica]
MGRKKREHSGAFRAQAVSLHEEGKSYRQIAAIMNVSFSTIRSIVMKYKSTGTTENKPRSGRPRVSVLKNKRTICLEQGIKALSTHTLDDVSTSNKMEDSEEIKMEPIEILPPLKIESEEIQNNLPDMEVSSSAGMNALAPSNYRQCNGKTSMKRNNRDERTNAGEAFEIHRLRSDKDEFAIYGENVGNRLRMLNPRAQMCVKNLMNVILYKAEVGYYDFPQVPLEC